MVKLLVRPSMEIEAAKLAEIFAISFGMDGIDTYQMQQLIRTFQGEISNDIVLFLVACLNNQIIGLGGETRHHGASYIGFLGVIPGHRRIGIGSTLLEKLIERAEHFNKTIELFSNPGVEGLYYKHGFRGEYRTAVIDIKPGEENYTDKKGVVAKLDGLPRWVLDLDKEAMGFDRTRLLTFLINYQGAKLACIDRKGFIIYTKSRIGPLIARDEETALILIKHSLATGTKRIIVPEHAMRIVEPFNPKILHECLKMTRGEPLESSIHYTWGYYSFATS
ncbi:MAG: GNAT family N-acetyltransferase [Candidatus Hodarchaeales archaeon]